MAHYPPSSQNEWRIVLNRLGFILHSTSPRARHGWKYIHPIKKPTNPFQPNFIIIPNKIYKQNSEHIIKEIKCFNFTDEEIKTACK